MKRIIVSTLVAAAALLGNTLAYAESEILLEGFEDNINNVIPATDGGSRGANGNIKLTHFTRTDSEEPWVTQGKKALQVEFLNNQKWWSVDFLIHLDQEAALELEAAWNGDPESGLKAEARYVLKYDVTFPGAGVVTWMNQAVNNNWEAAREWNTPKNNDAPVTVEIPLDLVGNDLNINDDGTTTLRFIDNADWPDGNIPKFFIDNIRLVDQWATDKPPTTMVIESFENDIGAVTTQGGRVTVEHYNADGAEDSNVTHGLKSLKVVLAQPEGWSTDWHLDLSNSEILNELLQLPLEERWRYILRFDTVFQERPPEGWGGGNWGYKFSTSVSLADTDRAPSDHSTYSVNLALANLDPGSPRITFYGNGGYSGEVVAYFDNFRILDTIQAPDIVIHSSRIEEAGFSFDWNSTVGSNYQVERMGSRDSVWKVIVEHYPEGGATVEQTSFTDPDLFGTAFYRVAETPVPPLYTEDFEAGAEGWEIHDITKTGTTWELGKPANGPGKASGGEKIYGTDLSNDYANDTDIYLFSPLIDLSGVEKARLMFSSYRDIEGLYEGNVADYAEVLIMDEYGDEYLTDEPIWFRVGSSLQWRQEKIAIPAEVVGQKIRIVFHFESDSWQDAGSQAGWFIDDVTITTKW